MDLRMKAWLTLGTAIVALIAVLGSASFPSARVNRLASGLQTAAQQAERDVRAPAGMRTETRSHDSDAIKCAASGRSTGSSGWLGSVPVPAPSSGLDVSTIFVGSAGGLMLAFARLELSRSPPEACMDREATTPCPLLDLFLRVPFPAALDASQSPVQAASLESSPHLDPIRNRHVSFPRSFCKPVVAGPLAASWIPGNDIRAQFGRHVPWSAALPIDPQGLPAAGYAALLLFVVGLLLGAAIWFALDRLLLSPRRNRESQVRYQTLAETAQDSIFILSREGVVQYVNTFAARQFGSTPAQVVGKSVEELFPLSVAQNFKEDIRRVFDTGQPIYIEQPTPFPDREIWLDTHLVPIQNEAGGVQALLGIARDVTEHRSTEEALREKVAALQTLTEIEEAITSTLSLSERLDILLEHILTQMHGDIAVVSLLEPITHDLKAFAQQGARNPRFWRSSRLRAGEGAAGWVADHGQPLAVPDVSQDPRWAPNEGTQSEGIVSYLGVPLRVDGRVIGVLSLGARTRREYTEEEINFLTTLGGRAAVAIENAQLFDETRRRANEFAALYETTRDLAAQQEDLSALLQTLVDRATTLLSAPGGGIYLYDAAHGDLALTVSRGEELPVGVRLAMGEDLAGLVAQTRQPLTIEDYRAWPHRSPKLEGVPFTAVVAVPMMYGGELIGVLMVNATGGASRRFAEADARLLSLFAAQGASAVHNARLFQETHTRAQQLALLYDAGLALNSVLEPRVLLEFLFKIAMKTLRASRAEVFRYDAAQRRIVFELSIGYPPEKEKELSTLTCSIEEEKSVVAWVGRSRVPLKIADVTVDPRWVTIDPEIRSGLWVPIEHENQLRGVLGVTSNYIDAFSPQDERLLVLFANQAAVAMENAHLYAEAQRRVREVALVNQISATVNQPLALADVLTTTLSELIRVLDVDRGAVAILDRTREHLTIIAEHSPNGGASLLGRTISLQENPSLQSNLVERRAIVIADAEEATSPAPLAALLREMGSRSALVVPLVTRDQVIGVIQLQARQSRSFSEGETVLAQTIANQAAAAVEKARLFEETQRRADQLAVLYRIASAVNRTLHLDELLEVIHREITATLTADASFIALYDPATQEMDFRVRVDEGIREPPERQPVTQGLTNRVLQTKEPVLIRDWQEEIDLYPAPHFWGTMKAPRSWLGVPMLSGSNVIGVISTQSYHPQAYGEDEVRLLSTVADHVAVLIENARLFEETKRRALEQTAVSEIASTLSAVMDVRQAFPTIVKGLRSLVDCEHVNLALLDETGDHILNVPLDETGLAETRGQVMVPAGSQPVEVTDGQVHLTFDLSRELQSPGERALHEAGYRSRANLPMLAGDQLIGTLNLVSRQVGAFSYAQIPALQQIANALAIAIQNTRLFEAEQTRRAELSALYDLSRALADAAGLDAILDLVTRRAVETMRVTYARLALVEGADLVVRAAHPIRLLGRDLGVGRREPMAHLPCSMRIMEQSGPTLISQEEPSLSAEERESLFLGVAATVCAVPLRVGERSIGLLSLGEARREEREPFTSDKMRLARSIGDQAASAIRRTELFEELERAYLQTVLSLANAVDAKDSYTADHAQRLANLALQLGERVGMLPRELEDLRYGALLHDVGKIGVPDAILQKPIALSAEEWVDMRRHPEIGAQILKPVPRLAGAAQIVRHHHERYDGTGYPDKLGGEDIPLGARILAVVDAYSAIVDKRVYKAAGTAEKAIDELRKYAGTQFDPRVVQVFLGQLSERKKGKERE